MRNLILFLTLMTFSTFAMANISVNINYIRVGQHDGPNLNMSLPGVKLIIKQSLLGDYSLKYSGVYANDAANDSTYWDSSVTGLIRYKLFNHFYTISGVGISRVSMAKFNNFNMSAWNVYTVADLKYIFNSIASINLSTLFGKDFDTQITNYNTADGLTYGVGLNGSYKIGPGFFTIGISYTCLPLTSQYGYHINTDELYSGYKLVF